MTTLIKTNPARIKKQLLAVLKKAPPATIPIHRSIPSFRKKEPFGVAPHCIRMFIVKRDLVNLLDISPVTATLLMQEIRAYCHLREPDSILMQDFICYSGINPQIAWMYLVFHPFKMNAYRRDKPAEGWMTYLRRLLKEMEKKTNSNAITNNNL